MRNVRMDIMNRGCGRLNVKLGDLLSYAIRHDGMSLDPVDELIHEIKEHVRLR